MAEAFVELGATGVNHLVENHWEKGYDRLTKGDRKKDRPGKSRNQLPSPERERDPPTRTAAAGDTAGDRRGSLRSESLERESETSRRVTREYENERDDPTRSVKSVLPDRRRGRDSAKMSYANGYAPSHGRSQRGRYDDDEDSDYDDREGRRYRTSGRGYDDRGDRGYPYDREIIETERYKGVSRHSTTFSSRHADRPSVACKIPRCAKDGELRASRLRCVVRCRRSGALSSLAERRIGSLAALILARPSGQVRA